MQANKWFIAVIAASALFLGAKGAYAQTNQAFQMDVKLKVSYEDPYTGKLGKQTITTSTIINLAQGININIPVPSNIVLAMVIGCDDPQGIIAVVDTDDNNAIKAIVGQLQVDGAVDIKGKGVASLLLQDIATGGMANGLYGGWLAIGGKVQLDDPEITTCPLKDFKSSSVSGIIQGLDAVSAGGEFKVTVTGGTLKTIKDIGFVPPIF